MEWQKFAADVDAAERAADAAEGGFAFAFVEGALVRALRDGSWLLLDEINLAPPEVPTRVPFSQSRHTGGRRCIWRGLLLPVFAFSC